MRLLRRAAWLATITTLLGATAAWWRSTSPAASAAPAAGPDGWVRIAPRQAAPAGATDGTVAYGRTRPPGCTHACFAGTGQHD